MASFEDFGRDIEDVGEAAMVVEEEEEEPLIVRYPEMIKRTTECKYCY